MSDKPQILIVEDDLEIQELLSLTIRSLGYDVEACNRGDVVMAYVKNRRYDLVITDWMLPEMTGIEVIRSLRSKYDSRTLPILMLTARSEPEDIVQGLDAGADDYLTKPFERAVLLARVRALLRRFRSNSGAREDNLIKVGELVLNLDTLDVLCGEEKVILTPSEFKLLQAMIQNRGKVLTRKKLIELVQGSGISVVDRAVDTHIFGLRKKLGSCSTLVETVRGVGYRVAIE